MIAVLVSAGSLVTRFDAAPLGQVKRTPQGFLRARARLTRTGVLTYRRKDGTVSRELRRPEQVFAPESLATLGDAPLTDLHPSVMVSPDNARELSVGHVSQSSVRVDGNYVDADVVVTDAKMIGAVLGGTRREISAGYKCKLVVGAGVYNGERYDAEQTNIVYNHAGIGPKQWGRAGAECAVRLDGGSDDFALDADDAYVTDAADAPDEDVDPKGPKGTAMELVTLRVDGIDCQVTPSAAQVLNKGITQRDESIAQASKDAAATKARLDALQGELDGTKAKLTEAADPKRFDTAVTERIGLLERARTVLGETTKLDGKSTREIKELVVLKLQPKAELAGKSDEYVSARFDACDDVPASTATDLSGVRRVATHVPRLDNNDAPATKYPKPAWQQPLAANRPR